MISAGDFENGMTFELDGNVVSIVEFQHVKPGKGAAFVRTKIKNVITGRNRENIQSNRKIPNCICRAQGYGISVFRWRSVLFYGQRNLRANAD